MVQLSFFQVYFLLAIFNGTGIIIGHLITKGASKENPNHYQPVTEIRDDPYQERTWDIGAYSDAWWNREKGEADE